MFASQFYHMYISVEDRNRYAYVHEYVGSALYGCFNGLAMDCGARVMLFFKPGARLNVCMRVCLRVCVCPPPRL